MQTNYSHFLPHKYNVKIKEDESLMLNSAASPAMEVEVHE